MTSEAPFIGSAGVIQSAIERIRRGSIRTTEVSGDGGSATNASLNFPAGIAVDTSGNLYIADGANNRIRKVSPTGIINTIAGDGTGGYSGDGGPATAAKLFFPQGIAVSNSAGNIYVADANNSIRLLQPINPTLSITAVANAASDVLAPIAPGEIVIIYGSGLGPTQLTSSAVDNSGLVPTSVAGTQVFFNDTAAPIIYSWSVAVCAIVPYGITGNAVPISVQVGNASSQPGVTIAVR